MYLLCVARTPRSPFLILRLCSSLFFYFVLYINLLRYFSYCYAVLLLLLSTLLPLSPIFFVFFVFFCRLPFGVQRSETTALTILETWPRCLQSTILPPVTAHPPASHYTTPCTPRINLEGNNSHITSSNNRANRSSSVPLYPSNSALLPCFSNAGIYSMTYGFIDHHTVEKLRGVCRN